MNAYDFTIKNAEGQETTLGIFAGKVLLLVNTATKCGLTPQYEGLEKLYEKYKEQGFSVIDFPCNQFLEQAPGTIEEIGDFCTLNYGTTFPRMAKVAVNGPDADPLFAWLKGERPVAKGDAETARFEDMVKQYTPDAAAGDISWNFNKFLIDRSGNVIERYSPAYAPERLDADIAAALATLS